jgi:hypothetical protein
VTDDQTTTQPDTDEVADLELDVEFTPQVVTRNEVDLARDPYYGRRVSALDRASEVARLTLGNNADVDAVLQIADWLLEQHKEAGAASSRDQPDPSDSPLRRAFQDAAVGRLFPPGNRNTYQGRSAG